MDGALIDSAGRMQMYQSGRSPRVKTEPDWIYKQTLPYPNHPMHKVLADNYISARLNYDRSVEVIQFGFKKRREDADPGKHDENIEMNQRQSTAAEEILEGAEAKLRQFNSHTPEQRINIYRAEIAELEPQLKTAREAEAKYTKALLEDPNIQAQRLEREVLGYGNFEYPVEKLTELRKLKSTVSDIESNILNCNRAIRQIVELASEAQRQEQVASDVAALLPEFNEACETFQEALRRLQNIAIEHGIAFDSRLKTPSGAAFQQGGGAHAGRNTIYFVWD